MKKSLGKGLDALFQPVESEEVLRLNLTDIRPNPYQPRKTFDDDTIKELAESIREQGVIQPIIVRRVLRGFEIVAGERRFRASQLCGNDKIPAVVRDMDDAKVMEIALIENLQREDLNAIETALAYEALMDKFSLTQEELSLKVGKSRSHIANFVRLLALPESIKEYVSRGTLSMGHARAIVGVKDQKIQLDLAEQVVESNWSVRELEDAITRMNEKKTVPTKKEKIKKKDPFIVSIESQLREKYQTGVKIKQSKNRGKIELEYYSKQDLERILELLQLQ
ncbi:MAG: ParB/RepB/Spo0J family partition protein [Candidatus Pristimantibacillus lignocellulolyticus]|uniref:ParB/RepB/Spo0J family partition protein n=1 Tax=Candidatus Pristimantibacillus lignocellulolyticus TaxID=2994561 RepID=A0A9J6ZIA9_9BACL|nr:MAG: ParB/RepB/Spo0J family partition protein [Candidatus Pristimantibacillus lignocellulolyticus]